VSAGPAPLPEHGARVRGGATALPPRRVSGPARGPRAVPVPAGPPPSPAGRWAQALRALPDARWVDRLLRGRAWILLIALALIGIVAMQVHLLKLNGGIGRAIEHAATLERQNAELRGAVARLESQERIQTAAGALGLTMPSAGDVRYLQARGARDARRAVRVMRAPDPPEQVAAAMAALAQQQALAAGTATAAAPDAAAAAAAPDPAAVAVAPAPDPAAAAAPAVEAAAPAVAPEPAAPAAAPAPAAPAPVTAPDTGAAVAPAE